MITTEIVTKNTQLEYAIKTGIIHWKANNPDEALRYFEEVRPLFHEADPLLKAKFHNNLGLVYKQKAEQEPAYLDAAIREYELVKHYLEQTDDPIAVGTIENNIANIQLLAGRTTEAHIHLDRAEALFRERDETFYAQAREIRARVLYAEKLYREAAIAINESERILLHGVENDPLVETLKTKAIISQAIEAQVCLEYHNPNVAAKRFGITAHGVRKKIKKYFSL